MHLKKLSRGRLKKLANRKLGRTTDIRKAMLKTLTTDLFLYGKIPTTEARAKEVKSIADSIDLGMHILPANQKDLDSLAPILSANTFEKPTTKLSIYKNRRGRYKGIYLWCTANLGICRVKPMFATTWDY